MTTEDNNAVDAGTVEGSPDPDATPGFISSVSNLDGTDLLDFSEDVRDGDLFPTVSIESKEAPDTSGQAPAPASAPAPTSELPPLVPPAVPAVDPADESAVLESRLREQQSFFTKRENFLVDLAEEAKEENAGLRERLARIEGRLGVDPEDEGTDPYDEEGTPNPALALTGPQLRALIDAEIGDGTADRLQLANEDEAIRDEFLQEIVDLCDAGEDVILDHKDELVRVMGALEDAGVSDVSLTAAWTAMKGGFRLPLEPIPAAETPTPAPTEVRSTDTSETAKLAQAVVAKARLLAQPSEVSGEDGLDPNPAEDANKVLDIRQAATAALRESGITSLSEMGLT